MRILRLTSCCMVAIAFTILLGQPSQAQTPPPPPTIWSFLGLGTTTAKARAQVVNRRGNRPNLEKKPPLKTIGDPANLQAPSAPIRAAAEIKQQEDLKLQKIKAIKYLASIGCGCYDKEGKVTAAMLAAMNDCTEEVRLAAVEGIAVAAMSDRCQYCNLQSCCNEKIVEQLAKMAYEYDDKGCMLEPSERVREAAKAAMRACCPGGAPPIRARTVPNVEAADPNAVEGAIPGVEGSGAVRPRRPDFDEAPAPPNLDGALLRPVPTSPSSSTSPGSSRRAISARAVSIDGVLHKELVSENFGDSISRFASTRLSNEEDTIEPPPSASLRSQPAPVETHVSDSAPGELARLERSQASTLRQLENSEGVVEHIDPRTGWVHIDVNSGVQLPIGARVAVIRDESSGTANLTSLEVIESEPGMATARPRATGKAPNIARGDHVVAYR